MTGQVEVTDNAAEHRYELHLDGEVVGLASYVDRDGARVFPHTEVDPRLQGRGLASQLVGAAMDAEAAAGRTVVPACSYVRRWLDNHPDHPVTRA